MRDEAMSRPRARRMAAAALEERNRAWKEMIDSGKAFELDEDCIRAHTLFLLDVLHEVTDLPVNLQNRIAWEQMQEATTGNTHPNVLEARKRVEELKKKVEYVEDQTNLEVEKADGIVDQTNVPRRKAPHKKA